MSDDKTLLSRRTVLKGSGASLGAAAVGLGGLAYSSVPAVAAEVDEDNISVSNDGGDLEAINANPSIEVDWINFSDEGPDEITVSIDEVRWENEAVEEPGAWDGQDSTPNISQTISEGELANTNSGTEVVDGFTEQALIDGTEANSFEPEPGEDPNEEDFTQDNYVQVDVSSEVTESVADPETVVDEITFEFVVTVTDTGSTQSIDIENSTLGLSTNPESDD